MLAEKTDRNDCIGKELRKSLQNRNCCEALIPKFELMGRPKGFLGFSWSSNSAILFENCVWVILILLAAIGANPLNASLDHELYSKHCQEFVPAPKAVNKEGGLFNEEAHALTFYHGSYEGGDPIFNKSDLTRSNSVSFSVSDLWQTERKDVFQFKGRLMVQSKRYGAAAINRHFQRPPSHFKFARPPRWMSRGRVLVIRAEGFYSNSSQRICMLGLGERYFLNGSSRTFLVSVKFSYPKTSTLVSGLINGTVESLDKENSFEPISIYAMYDGFYEYTRVEDAKRVCSVRKPDVLDANKDILKSGNLCNLRWLRRPLDLVWNRECSGRDCSPFNVSDRGSLPNSMLIENLKCTPQGQVHGFFRFSNLWNSGLRFTLPEIMLIGEGVFDAEKGQLCMVACLIENGGRILKKLSEEDCGISISMQFLTTLTVVDRYMVVGHVQYQKGNIDSMYFKNFTFKGPAGIDRVMGTIMNLPNLQYKYTKLDQVRKVCNKTFAEGEMSLVKNQVRRYPDGSSFGDLGFDVSVENSGKWRMQGYAYPFTVGNRYERDLQLRPLDRVVATHGFNHGSGPLNVSYNLKFRMPFRQKWDEASQANESFVYLSSISAEGIYNPLTGLLCMIGCRHVGSSGRDLEGDMDCQIHIKVKYASLNPEQHSKEHISGSITSLRTQKDPYYFKPINFSSTTLYTDQAEKIIWRKDLEIIMGLVSLSLTAAVIYIQLVHVRRHPNVLPFVSLLMLTVLTLGHMIPLLLNFEAFFMNQKGKNVLQLGGGWLEVNEVVVRIMTMVVFLLQLRLLQLVWTARLAVAGEKTAWFWERKVLYICLPLYVFGGLIACIVHLSGASHSNSRHFIQKNTKHALWQDFRAYAGLILDGFLLPQVLGNFFFDIKDIILVPYFYIGITLVRSIPHAYDAYRVIWYIPLYHSSYFYANRDLDFYSIAWDIVIPCGALLLTLLVFLQQRFGGRCVVPRKFRDRVEYQKIPIVDG